jgi:hypothetical protein
MRYQLVNPGGILILDSPVNTTFNPGMNVSFIGITTSTAIAAGNYTLTTVATAQTLSSTSSTSFGIAGGAAPTLTLSVQPNDKAPILTNGASIVEVPASIREILVDEGRQARPN